MLSLKVSRDMQLIGGVAAVAFGFILLLRLTQRRGSLPRGLSNFGNACYINAVLQSLSSCPSFISFIKMVASEVGPESLAHACLQVCLAVNSPSTKYESVSAEVIAARIFASSHLQPGAQEDAHEFLFLILTALINELTLSVFKYQLLSETAPHGDQYRINLAARSVSSDASSLGALLQRHGPTASPVLSPALATLFNPLRLVISQKKWCSVCKTKKATRLSTHCSLSLHIPPNDQLLSLSDLILLFRLPETLDDVICEHCSDLGSQGLRLKQEKEKADQAAAGKALTMEMLREPEKMVVRRQFVQVAAVEHMPPLLCIHINRVLPTHRGMVKTNALVRFPTVLAADELGVRATSYALQAVIVHTGSVSDGHYLCYRRMVSRGGAKRFWFRVSDDIVSRTHESEVLSSNPAMLFYERM